MQARTQVLDHLGEGTAISGDAISKFLGHVHIDVLKGQRDTCHRGRILLAPLRVVQAHRKGQKSMKHTIAESKEACLEARKALLAQEKGIHPRRGQTRRPAPGAALATSNQGDLSVPGLGAEGP